VGIYRSGGMEVAACTITRLPGLYILAEKFNGYSIINTRYLFIYLISFNVRQL
jgi:hypothetical protein